jgi:hypothetical protein
MNILQQVFLNGHWETKFNNGCITNNSNVQLALVFGDRKLLLECNCIEILKKQFPNSEIISCSTAGEISNNCVYDDSIQAVIIEFSKTTIKTETIFYMDYENGFEAGKALINKFDPIGLSYIYVLSDGSFVNGSDLTDGMNSVLEKNIPITGGLAGDNDRFEKTIVGINNNYKEGQIVAVGFYGDSIQVGHSSLGGWDLFGPEKTVTNSEKNILSELDNKNALAIYKEYLGQFSENLPSSALLFPLAVKIENKPDYVVRTILNIDEDKQTMTFAGNIPLHSKVRLMKANFNRLIEASSIAANTSLKMVKEPKLALLISCVGRKIILGPRVDEEVEAVRKVVGDKTIITGFYSYGEISPFNSSFNCELHNQTMTITTFNEL